MSEIINFYTKIDDKLLKKTPNPNYKDHHLNIPFRGVIVAPSGSGKTNFLVNLIRLFSHRKEGTFSSIIVITRNKDEPLYNYLAERKIQVLEGLRNTPDLDKYDSTEAHLVVFDDLVLAKDLKVVEEYYLRCRKMNVSVLFLSQRYYPVPKMIRENCNYLFILKMGNVKDVKLIMSEMSLNVTKEQLMNMYEYATHEKFNVLLIDKETTDDSKKFRHNFLNYLNPSNFK